MSLESSRRRRESLLCLFNLAETSSSGYRQDKPGGSQFWLIF
jgi:hypothetical protein